MRHRAGNPDTCCPDAPNDFGTGLDSEFIAMGVELAAFHIEAGARRFATYARTMVDDLGEKAKPYLKSWYMGVKYHPCAAHFEGMDDAVTVEQANIDKILRETGINNQSGLTEEDARRSRPRPRS